MTTPPETVGQGAAGSTVKFGLICAALFAVSIWLPEGCYEPLNRCTARLTGMVLAFFGAAPAVHGAHVSLPGCRVVIVTECTGLYMTLLFISFVAAHPATWKAKACGVVLGALFLNAVNIARIACVSAIGSWSPHLFEPVHVYLAQIMMVLLVCALCSIWRSLLSTAADPLPFVFRTLLLVSILFLPWLAVNRLYVASLDRLVQAGHALLYHGYRLDTPRPFAIYNHTFAVPFFVSLVMASRGIARRRQLAGCAAGVAAIAGCHLLFRVTHVLWTAHHMEGIVALHQAVYLLGQYLLPLFLWLFIAYRPAQVSGAAG